MAARVFELRFPIEPDQPRSAIWLDYRLAIVSVLVVSILSWPTMIVSNYLVRLCGNGLLTPLLGTPNTSLLLIMYVIVLDLYGYWFHRLSHAIPFLWELHSLHHSADSITLATGVRHYWLDSFLMSGIVPIFAILVRMPPDVAFAGSIIFAIPQAWAHLNVRISLGRFTLWINNPQLHRIHHSNQSKHADKNFAPMFPLWDVLFGTAYNPGPGEFPPTGLADGETPRDAFDAVIWPFRSVLRG